MTTNIGARTPMGVLTDIAACLAFMSRLRFRIAGAKSARATADGVWALPIAGAFMGAVAGAAYAIASGFAFWPILAAALAVAAGALATGARGEWGLAATADSWAGEAPDGGRLGAAGTCALMLAVVLRIAVVAAFIDIDEVMAALMGAGALGAAAAAGVLYYMPLAGEQRPPASGVTIAGVIALVIAFLALPFGVIAAVILAAAVAAGLAAAHRRLAGEMSPAALAGLQLACEIAALLAVAASD